MDVNEFGSSAVPTNFTTTLCDACRSAAQETRREDYEHQYEQNRAPDCMLCEIVHVASRFAQKFEVDVSRSYLVEFDRIILPRTHFLENGLESDSSSPDNFGPLFRHYNFVELYTSMERKFPYVDSVDPVKRMQYNATVKVQRRIQFHTQLSRKALGSEFPQLNGIGRNDV